MKQLGPLTIFVGPNAVGKTNIIEGIQLLTALTSFRHGTIEQMIYHGESQARLEAHMTDDMRLLDVALSMEGHSRKYSFNGKAKRPSDLKGLMPSVCFTPDDLELVKGSMSERRRALDTLGSQLNANYYLITRDFEKVLRHKNKLLKEEATVEMIDAINDLFLTCATSLTCYRAALFRKLIRSMQLRYADLADKKETLTGAYNPAWASDPRLKDQPNLDSKDAVKEALAFILEQKKFEEREKKHSLVGPQTDQVLYFLDGYDATHYASQGQQRSIVLAEKLAEAAVIEEMLDKKPLLLLDDVMSELDGQRRNALVRYISDDVQTFITTANLAYFDDSMLASADVVELGTE